MPGFCGRRWQRHTAATGHPLASLAGHRDEPRAGLRRDAVPERSGGCHKGTSGQGAGRPCFSGTAASAVALPSLVLPPPPLPPPVTQLLQRVGQSLTPAPCPAPILRRGRRPGEEAAKISHTYSEGAENCIPSGGFCSLNCVILTVCV